MNVKILLSTTNKEKIEELDLKRKNIKDCIVVNQIPKQIDVEKKENCSMFSYNEIGLSKSRNRLIENLSDNVDIAIITDDDVNFVRNYDNIVENAYKKIKDADIIVFKSYDENGKPRRKYPKKSKKLTTFELLSVCSIEITFKVKSIKNKVKFNEKFGLASTYKSGEENIFLEECSRKGLKIYFYNEYINIHANESTGTYKWSKQDIFDKGALFKELFPVIGYYMVIPICILKRNNLNIGVIEAIKIMYKGMIQYAKMVKEK